MSRGAYLGTALRPSPVRAAPVQPVLRGSARDQQRVTSSQQASTSGDNSRNLSSRGKSSTRAWQHQWRYMRSERARSDQSLPKVDWTRYHLQVGILTCVFHGILAAMLEHWSDAETQLPRCRSAIYGQHHEDHVTALSCNSISSVSPDADPLHWAVTTKSMCLQILFVDRSDTVRARVAAGLLERIAEWNGYGRALYPCACGVEAAKV